MEDQHTGISEKEKKHKRRVKALRLLLIRTFVLVLILYALFFHVVGLTIMPNNDMSPRIDTGDLLLYYRLEHNIKAQDVVVIEKSVMSDMSSAVSSDREDTFIRKALNWIGFKDPNKPAQQFVCRVIACPGDEVSVTDETGLTINGNAVVETNIYYPTKPYDGYIEYPVKLQNSEYFVLSDSRNGGADSRFFGIVKKEEIKGILITLVRRNSM